MAKTYDELALEMGEALKAAKQNIPPNIMGKSTVLEKDDYKTIATSIFIERNRQLQEEARQSRRKGQGSNGKPREDVPSTEPQQSYIARLIEQKEDAPEIVAGFLDANGTKSCMDLTSAAASKLIDQLKTLKDK